MLINSIIDKYNTCKLCYIHIIENCNINYNYINMDDSHKHNVE